MCHEPVIDIRKLPEEIAEKVYRPTADEIGREVTIDLRKPQHFVPDEREEIDLTVPRTEVEVETN